MSGTSTRAAMVRLLPCHGFIGACDDYNWLAMCLEGKVKRESLSRAEHGACAVLSRVPSQGAGIKGGVQYEVLHHDLFAESECWVVS